MDEAVLVGRVLLSLACVVGLVWYLARRFGRARSVDTSREAELHLVNRQALGRHAGVAVVAVGNRRLLVGFGEQGVSMLTELAPVVDLAPAPAPTPAPAPAAAAPRDRPAGEPAGALTGSVLSPQTWRATVRALQDRTVRR